MGYIEDSILSAYLASPDYQQTQSRFPASNDGVIPANQLQNQLVNQQIAGLSSLPLPSILPVKNKPYTKENLAEIRQRLKDSETKVESEAVDPEIIQKITDTLNKSPYVQKQLESASNMEDARKKYLNRDFGIDTSSLTNYLAWANKDPEFVKTAVRRPSAEDLYATELGANDKIGNQYQALQGQVERALAGQLKNKITYGKISDEELLKRLNQTNIPPATNKPSATDIKQQETIGQNDAKFQNVASAVDTINNIISKYPTMKDVPGIGFGGTVESIYGKTKSLFGGKQSPSEADAASMKTAIDVLLAMEIKDRSGAAFSTRELDMAKEAISGGNFATKEDFVNALNNYLTAFNNAKAALYKGFQSPNVGAVRGRSNQAPGEVKLVPKTINIGGSIQPNTANLPESNKSKTERLKALGF